MYLSYSRTSIRLKRKLIALSPHRAQHAPIVCFFLVETTDRYMQRCEVNLIVLDAAVRSQDKQQAAVAILNPVLVLVAEDHDAMMPAM